MNFNDSVDLIYKDQQKIMSRSKCHGFPFTTAPPSRIPAVEKSTQLGDYNLTFIKRFICDFSKFNLKVSLKY